jgi:hypothetical protein
MRRTIVPGILGVGGAAALGLWLWMGGEQGWAKGGSSRVPGFQVTLAFERPWQRELQLGEGETIELSVAVEQPSNLPSHGRIGVKWELLSERASRSSSPVRASDPHAIGGAPTAGWRKVLHALDPDLYLVYRAPVAGRYRLEVAPVIEEVPIFEGTRWREEGQAPAATPFPRRTPWPVGHQVPLTIELSPIDLQADEGSGMFVELEPNDSPELAQPISLPSGEGGPAIQSVRISGGADDIEYFDNGAVGRSGEDWFQLEYSGREPQLLTAALTIPDQAVVAQLRLYTVDAEAEPEASPEARRGTASTGGWPRPILSMVEYTEGRNENERVHQQNEGHRVAIVRRLKPGGIYFLRVEANAPGYEVELRILPPAPYADPRLAVRQAMYDHIGQVDAWLANRPRGASVERRIRETGNLMGTHCMSCHTQSGVWGPVVPIEQGYRVENLQHYRRMINLMYESLRPTNYLLEAANNTSLPPLDIGDGPAGTRVTGHAVASVERIRPPRKLHSQQLVRAANLILQTADPSGINAAGPGSNVGQSVVYGYAGEVLRRAWDRTAHPRYLAALEEKAGRLLAVTPRYTDDLAHRIEFFRRFFPADYLRQSAKAHLAQAQIEPEPPPPSLPMAPQPVTPATSAGPTAPPPAQFPTYRLQSPEEALAMEARIRRQLVEDETRLRAIQNRDGSWGFDPGKRSGDETSWRTDGESDPAPTALALSALEALGHRTEDPAVARGVAALLRVQDPYGRWNKSAQTGFVTTAYVMHALARLYPVSDRPEIPEATTLRGRIARARSLSHAEDRAAVEELTKLAGDASPWVRMWAVMGLGALPDRRAVPTLIGAMGDRVKMVREAAAWAVEQTLLDDTGSEEMLTAAVEGEDRTRETVMKALGMRADAVLPAPHLALGRVAAQLARGLNDDPHPGVRAWAAKAAWQWWVWNPPVRSALQQAWVRKLQADESNALVENTFRYQSHALFIVNGHKANGSEEHQYPELTVLFAEIESRLDDPALTPLVKDRLARRLVSIAATFYNTSGGDGGPGQMGYLTERSSEMIGKAVLHLWDRTSPSDLAELRLVLEGASGVGYGALQDRVIGYSTAGPESLRTVAAAAVSDPSTVTLPATEEKVGPLVEQIHRGAQDYDRRQTLAAPVLRLLARANWAVPKTTEQRDLLYRLLIPHFDEAPQPEQLTAIIEAAADAVKPMGQQNADWYLADRMGATLAANPDLQTDELLRFLPETIRNPLIAHFWLPSVRWIMEYGEGVPAIGKEQGAVDLPLEVRVARDRAVTLYQKMLTPEAPAMTRSLAFRLANQTALRQRPEIAAALRTLVEREGESGTAQAARLILRQAEPEAWVSDLQDAVRREPLAAPLRDGAGEPRLSPAFLASFQYFRDHVAPELNRPQRMDEMSCLRCHGVRGRVPSMELEAADGNGYWTMTKMLRNYLILQQRVDPASPEGSKLLRKPLNIQTGEEDGHQGGRRYTPGEKAYQILRRWVLDQPRVQEGQRLVVTR